MVRVPRPRPGRDIKSLPLQPTEAYILSRADGVTDERELALLSNLPAAQVAAVLDKLLAMGVIEIVSAPAQKAGPKPMPGSRPADKKVPPPRSPPPRSPPPSSPPSILKTPPKGVEFGRNVFETAPTPPLYDPADLDEDVELERDKKQRILDLYYRLDQLTHYDLLGVGPQAEKKQVKSAYYLLAPEVHPDKFFRKKLGSYKAKIEAIFTRLTIAHDVLTSKERRAEYDDYLQQTHQNRTMAALLEQTARDVVNLTSALDEAAQAKLNTAQPGRYSDAPPAGEERPRDPVESLRERRETFARKLGGLRSVPPVRRGVSSVPPKVVVPANEPKDRPREVATLPPVGAQAAAQSLKARYEAAVGEAKRSQLARYTELGKAALDRKDYASAANAYRIAASLAPDDGEIQRASADAHRLAAAVLAEGYLRQAQYEANQDRWLEAALSYSKVCAGRPDDARAHERVAFSTLKSNGNVRRAVEFARRAVELAPTTPDFRLTLARAYAAAGFEKSALGEIDRAVELAPNDARIKDIAAHLRNDAQRNGKLS
jgi:curved DNA-binding protein CbpA